MTDKKTERLSPLRFKNFVADHPYFLWSTQQIQQKFLQKNLGEAYWIKKRMQYSFVRKYLAGE